LYKSILSFLLLFPVISTASAATNGFEVVSSGDTEFHFTVITDARLSNLEYEQTDDGRTLAFRSVLIGIPSGSNVKLLSTDGRSPVPISSQSGELPMGKISASPLVEISRPFEVRGRRMVNVRVNPFIGNTVYGEVEVRIGFVGDEVDDRGIPGDDGPVFERLFSASLANYDQTKQWPSTPRRSVMTAFEVENDLLKATTWYKVIVTETGLYRVTGSQMAQAGISLTALDPDSIRLFNAGGVRLNEDNDSARSSFEEVAIIIEGGEDGRFDSGDQFLFFGEAASRWIFEPNLEPHFESNPYTTQNVYWLAVSGSFSDPAVRMVEVNTTPSGTEDTIFTSFSRRARAEQENLFSTGGIPPHIFDYYTWFWSDETDMTIFIPTPGAIPGATASLEFVAHTNTGTGGASYMDVAVNSISATDKDCNGRQCSFETTQLLDGLNQFDLQLGPAATNTPPYFNNVEIAFQSRLRPDNNKLDFALGSYDGRALIEVDDLFSSDPLILDLDNPRRPRLLTGYERTSGFLSFEIYLSSTGPNRFFSSRMQQVLAPVSVTEVSVNDLHDISRQADFIIVTTEAFAPYLDEYMTYRESQGYSIKLAMVSDIMDNFSYGLYDPTAIRDYLKFAYENYPTPAPSTVLMVGDGNYDFLDHLGRGVANHVPPCIRQTDSVYSDDAYVHFGKKGMLDSDTSYTNVPDRGFDMLTARWPVVNGGEILAIIQKVMNYETSGDLGFWRNKIALVADDQFGGDNSNEIFHTQQAEELDEEHIPSYFGREKIYLWEFPFVNRQKPAVNDAIVGAFNRGALIVNYIGHGNPDVWAHEHVFGRGSDLPRLTNTDRLPLVYAASCAISFFDDPQREGMGEDLLSMSNGGAVGVIAATRLVYSSSNKALNQKVFDILLDNDSLSMCEALYAAKLQRQYPGLVRRVNDQKYIFFGDPFVALADPKLDIEFTEAPDSLIALGRSVVTGRVVDDIGQTVSLDGTLLISALDSDRDKLFQLINSDGQVVGEVAYKVPGASIYRGSATVTAGTFDFEFIVPLDVGYGGTGAKVAVYAVLDTIDASGKVDNIAISNSIVETTDSAGPEIAYTVVGRSNFVSGDVVSRTESLEIRLSDSSGINLADNLGHGISLEIDDLAEQQVNLTDLFEYDQDDVTSGSLLYLLESLESGPHQFLIKAWDNANNLSVARFNVEIVTDTRLAVNNLLNYPNPMADSTTFYFELTQPVERFSLELFTLSGKKIMGLTNWGLAADNYPNDDVSLVWNGRDADGDRVATGVYIYKASARPVNGGDEVELFGKLVVIN